MIERHLLKKTTVINKIVPDFMDTLYKHFDRIRMRTQNCIFLNINLSKIC